MTEFISAKFLVSSGKIVGSLIPSAIPFCLAEAGLIGQDTGLSFVVVGSIVGGAWYLNGRLTKIEDGLEVLKRDVAKASSEAATAATAAAVAVVSAAQRRMES